MTKYVVAIELVIEAKNKTIAENKIEKILSTSCPEAILLDVAACSLSQWDKKNEENV